MLSASLGRAPFSSNRASPLSRVSAATKLMKGSVMTGPSAMIRVTSATEPSPIQARSSRPKAREKSRAAPGWRKIRLPCPVALVRSSWAFASSLASSSAISAASVSASGAPLPRRRSEIGRAASPAGSGRASARKGGSACAMGAVTSSAKSLKLGCAPSPMPPDAAILVPPWRVLSFCRESLPVSSVASKVRSSQGRPRHSSLPAVRRRLASKPCSASLASCQPRLSASKPSSDSSLIESPSPRAGRLPSRSTPAPARRWPSSVSVNSGD